MYVTLFMSPIPQLHWKLKDLDFEYLRLYVSQYGRSITLGLLERSGVYYGLEHYTHNHGPIDAMRAGVFHSCRWS